MASPLFRLLLDDIDLSILEGRPASTLRDYRIYGAGEACSDSLLDGFQDESVRYDDSDDASYYLYQLLKRAPFLPIDEPIDESLDVSALVRRYLVDRSPLAVRPTQLLLAAHFDSAGIRRIPRDSRSLEGWFGQMSCQREKQFEAQVLATRLRRQVQSMGGQLLAMSKNVDDALHYKFIRNFPVKKLGNDAILRPEKFHAALKNRLSEFERRAAQGLEGKSYEHLHFHILARPIDFRRFRRLNPHLRIPDGIVARAAAARDMRTTVEGVDLEQFAELGERLRLAYAENCDARAKADRILAVWTAVAAFFQDKADGETTLMPIRQGMLIRFVPSCVVSAHVFINDFFPGADKRVKGSLSLFDTVLEGLPPWPIGRGARVEMVMAVTGPGDDVLRVLDSVAGFHRPFSWETDEVIVSIESSDHMKMWRLRTKVGRNATPSDSDVALFVANAPTGEISAAATAWFGRAPARALKMLVVREGSWIGDVRIKVVTGLGILPIEDLGERLRKSMAANLARLEP